MRTAVRQTRPQKRLVHRSDAEVPEGLKRQRQWRLKTIRLVLPIFRLDTTFPASLQKSCRATHAHNIRSAFPDQRNTGLRLASHPDHGLSSVWLTLTISDRAVRSTLRADHIDCPRPLHRKKHESARRGYQAYHLHHATYGHVRSVLPLITDCLLAHYALGCDLVVMLSTRAQQRPRSATIQWVMLGDRWPALHRIKRNFKLRLEVCDGSECPPAE